jgi:hypothetical protein
MALHNNGAWHFVLVGQLGRAGILIALGSNIKLHTGRSGLSDTGYDTIVNHQFYSTGS